MVINDKIRCLCLNSSYTGKYCEITKLTRMTTEATTTASTATTAAETKRTKAAVITTTSSYHHTSSSKRIRFGDRHSTSAPKDLFYQGSNQLTTRAYFWQCPSNCFHNLARGFCALSQSGYPHCVCQIGWTGIDCSQKNFCADNNCNNNSTCVNFPEKK